MAVSEGYVIEYLLRETEADPENVEWLEGEAGGYSTTFNLVRLQLYSVQSMSGVRLGLEFGLGHDTVYIQEPRKVAIFGRQYRNEDEERAAARRGDGDGDGDPGVDLPAATVWRAGGCGVGRGPLRAFRRGLRGW